MLNTLWSHRFICQSLYFRYAVCIGISIRWLCNISITWVTFTSNKYMTSFWAHDAVSISIPLLPLHWLTGLKYLEAQILKCWGNKKEFWHCCTVYVITLISLYVQTTDKSIKCLLVLRYIDLWHVSLWTRLPKVHEACLTPCQVL